MTVPIATTTRAILAVFTEMVFIICLPIQIDNGGPRLDRYGESNPHSRAGPTVNSFLIVRIGALLLSAESRMRNRASSQRLKADARR